MRGEDRLKSERGVDGEWHVTFTTAVRTLCGRVRVAQKRGRPARPTCEQCVRTAHRAPFIGASGLLWR